MPRVEPRRWRTIATIIVVSAIAGLAIVSRANRGASTSPSAGDFALGALVGAGVGLLVGLLVLLYFARNDARRFEVERMLPQAVVVQAKKDKDLVEMLHRIEPSATPTGSLITVAFGSEGVSLWQGGSRPVRLAHIPAYDVIEVMLGSAFKPFGNAPYERIAVKVQGADEAIKLQFALDRAPNFGSNRSTMNEAELMEVVHSARERLAGRAFSSTASAAAGVYGAVMLVPGATAWAIARLARVVSIAVPISGALFILGYLVLTRPEDRNGLAVVVPILLSQVVFFAPLWIGSAAQKRERAAGYTTLNGVLLDLPQAHPRTGRVLRLAGALALSKEVFRDELLR